MIAEAQDRVHSRYRVDLVVTMKWRRNTAALRVQDVSDGGMFLVTNDPPELRELVRLEFKLPGTGEAFAVHGMSVNIVKEGDPGRRTPGVGVQFYAVDRETQRTWDRFIMRLRQSQPPEPILVAAPPVPAAPRILTPLPVPRVDSRAPLPPPLSMPPLRLPITQGLPSAEPPPKPQNDVCLELDIPSLEELQLFYTRDIAAGGMFIVTESVLPLDTALSLFLRHPITHEHFQIDAIVRRIEDSTEDPGLDVEFAPLDAAERAALWHFVGATGTAAANEDDAFDAALGALELADEEPVRAATPPEPAFDPWAGAAVMSPWSRPPLECELDGIFGALNGGDVTGVRRSVAPMPMTSEAPPDFELDAPSWGDPDTEARASEVPMELEIDLEDFEEVAVTVRPSRRYHEEPIPMVVPPPLARAR